MAQHDHCVDSPSGSDHQTQAQKRVRTSRPKVKTGCSVCKSVFSLSPFLSRLLPMTNKH